jgi:hypothetical protein
VNDMERLAEKLDGTQVTVRFTKGSGRVRQEHGTLQYQPEKARVRVAKDDGGFKLIGFVSIVGIVAHNASDLMGEQ